MIAHEKVLPALEAVHIKRYRSGGEHKIQNGILARSDIWKLFHTGYVTVTPEYRFDVSEHIREEFENGGYYDTFRGERIYVPLNQIWKLGANFSPGITTMFSGVKKLAASKAME